MSRPPPRKTPGQRPDLNKCTPQAEGHGNLQPRLLGIDERGREILTFIEGEVVEELSEPLSEARLVSAGRLIRMFHDATIGFSLAGPAEVVCHGELGPHNTVFVGGTRRSR
jgi:hypothetical protein